MNWWENIPQCKVGDLVRHKRFSDTEPRRPRKLLLVIEVNPTKPCRVNPVQLALAIDNNGRERRYKSSRLEVISESR